MSYYSQTLVNTFLFLFILKFSSHRVLKPYLMKYSLCAEVIPLEQFLHHAHFEGECLFSRSNIGSQLDLRRIDTFSSIHMIKISRTNAS